MLWYFLKGTCLLLSYFSSDKKRQFFTHMISNAVKSSSASTGTAPKRKRRTKEIHHRDRDRDRDHDRDHDHRGHRGHGYSHGHSDSGSPWKKVRLNNKDGKYTPNSSNTVRLERQNHTMRIELKRQRDDRQTQRVLEDSW